MLVAVAFVNKALVPVTVVPVILVAVMLVIFPVVASTVTPCISFHLKDESPKDLSSSVEGSKSESTRAVKVIVSVLALPTSVSPKILTAPVTVRSPPMVVSSVTSKSSETFRSTALTVVKLAVVPVTVVPVILVAVEFVNKALVPVTVVPVILVAVALVNKALVPVTVTPLTTVLNFPLSALIVVPVKVTAFIVEPSIDPPVMLVPLMVPVTVTFSVTTIPLIFAKLLTVNPDVVLAPETVKSS